MDCLLWGLLWPLLAHAYFMYEVNICTVVTTLIAGCQYLFEEGSWWEGRHCTCTTRRLLSVSKTLLYKSQHLYTVVYLKCATVLYLKKSKTEGNSDRMHKMYSRQRKCQFEVSTTMQLRISVFCDATLHHWLSGSWHFQGSGSPWGIFTPYPAHPTVLESWSRVNVYETCNAAWLFWGEPSNSYAMPTAAVYSVREVS